MSKLTLWIIIFALLAGLLWNQMLLWGYEDVTDNLINTIDAMLQYCK